MAGFKDPPEHSRFQAGVSGNPGGKSSEQRQREMRNAEMATRLRERMLEAELAKLESAEHVPALDANMLKLIKDSEDRGLGAPTQPTEVSVGFTQITRRIVE
jgi:hypothetical protein